MSWDWDEDKIEMKSIEKNVKISTYSFSIKINDEKTKNRDNKHSFRIKNNDFESELMSLIKNDRD